MTTEPKVASKKA